MTSFRPALLTSRAFIVTKTCTDARFNLFSRLLSIFASSECARSRRRPHNEPLARRMFTRLAPAQVTAPTATERNRVNRGASVVTRVRPDGGACQETAGAKMNVGRPVYTAITQKLTRALAPTVLNVIDESAMHAGHVGNPSRGDPSAETHFRVEIVSDAFEGKRQVMRHRMIYDALSEEMDNPIHALQLKTKTPSEVSSA